MLKRLAIIALVILAICLTISYPFCRGRFYASKIIKAVQQNDVDVVKSLLDKGINVNTKNSIGEPLLIISIKNKYKEITNLLLEKGADVNIQQDTFTVGEEAIPSYFKELVSGRIKPTTVGGLSAIHWAVFKDDTDLIETLLAKGANIDAVNAQGQTPLHFAVIDGQTEIIKLLLSRGANANIKDLEWGHTPLHNAVTFCLVCKPEIINLLLEHGADLDVVDKKGLTLIQYAYNRPEIVKLFISKGANVNTRDAYGSTLLHYASGKGDSDLVKILMSNGANLDIKDKEGITPLDIAISRGCTDIVEILKKHGAKTGAEIKQF